MPHETLARTIRALTGDPSAAPRPGQSALVRDIEKAVDGTSHCSAEAPTGLGKSFALLAPAFHYAVSNGLRTVISTESLSLMEQISSKDAPFVAGVVKESTGTEPTFSVLKGFSNYVCARAAREASDALAVQSGATATVAGRLVDRRSAQKLAQWANRLPPEAAGDKQSYQGSVDDTLWGTVSIGAGECLRDDCPMSVFCKPLKARKDAGEADVVITNHSMLAVQAAKGVPVLIGNAQLGDFDIIMVDEAHALPAAVRGQGTSEISAARIGGMARSLSRDLELSGAITRTGHLLATLFTEDARTFTAKLSGDEVHRFVDGDDPLENSGDTLLSWAKEAKRSVDEEAKDAAPGRIMQLRRLAGRFDQLAADVVSARKHRLGTARWAGLDSEGAPVIHTALVNVAPAILSNLWRAEVKPDEEEASQPGDPKPLGEEQAVESEEKEYRDLAVVCVSGTLPKGFTRDAGLTATTASYPSPFDDAYGGSALLIPKMTAEEASQVFSAPRSRFSTAGHRDWAAGYTSELVEANGGSAIVLSASGSNGKAYAEALRATSRGWKVLSQWDGKPAGQLVDEWRADHDSVLVGTRSFMTGVDAKGSTCSLVVIDRPARSPSNPVDEARVEYLMEALDMDKWSADRLVYVADAAALLEQAAGRLIRSVDDQGLVAFLEPRMLKSSPQSYPAPTKTAYMHALRRFSNLALSIEQASPWLCRKTLQAA